MDSDDELFSAKVIDSSRNTLKCKHPDETQSEQMFVKD